MPLAGGTPLAEYPGAADALAFASEELWISREGAVAPAGSLAAGAKAPVRALVGAAGARRVLAMGADGEIRCLSAGAAAGRWRPVIDDVRAISLSDDGDWATLAGPNAVAVVRATDGAVGVYLTGASSIAMAADRRVVVGGAWGMALIVPVEETA